MAEIKITKWSANVKFFYLKKKKKILTKIIQIQQEGIYFFGGKNTKGEIVSELKILKTDCKPFIWLKPEQFGK